MSRRFAIAVIVLATAVHPGAGQEGPRVPFHGSELLRFALHTKKLTPATHPNEVLRSPATSVIVILGNTRGLVRILTPDQLLRFLANGGTVLLATDRTTDGHFGWDRDFGIRISGRQLKAAPRDSYGNAETRPFVRAMPLNPAVENTAAGLFAKVPDRGPEAIATDGPSELTLWFIHGGRMPKPVARYPVTTRPPIGPPIPATTCFAAVLRSFEHGRMLVLADHGVFANGMMGFEATEQEPGYRLNNGNWAFTNRAIDWLQEGPHGPRTRCLFVEDGNIIDQFAVQIPTPPRPPIPDIPPEVLANILLNSANGIINEAQQQNFFNRLVEGVFGFDRLVRLFLLFATILFLFFSVRWLRRAYRRPERAVGNPAAHAALVPRGGVLRQRTAAQIEVGNLYEAAARRVRDRFDVLGGRPAAAGEMPPVLVAIDVRDAPVLTQTVRWLWGIGYGPAPVNVPPVEWDRLNNQLERVTARAAHGDWSFGPEAG